MNNQELNPFMQIFWNSLNESQKSVLHSLAACVYSKDFYTLQNILNGNLHVTYVYQRGIDNAEEYYKQLNKSLLIFRDLSYFEKQGEEARIDAEARNLKSKWTKTLQDYRIPIIQESTWYGK